MIIVNSPKIEVFFGDSQGVLKTFKDKSVHCVVTSPPFFGLRDYGTAFWVGGDHLCSHNPQKPDGGDRSDRTLPLGRGGLYKSVCGLCGAVREDMQIGLELSPKEYVDRLVGVFREIKRVLRDDGNVWLNLGDSYSGSGKGQTADGCADPKNTKVVGMKLNNKVNTGLKPKDLIGIPWMVAFALRADGWYLRQDIIWKKDNPMPESVTDRCTKSHEYIFLLSKSQKYYFDNEAIKEVANYDGRTDTTIKGSIKYAEAVVPGQPKQTFTVKETECWQRDESGTCMRNKRDVWTVNTLPYIGAHFATFPPDLITPCILAGTSQFGVCSVCGSPYVRVLDKKRMRRNELDPDDPRYRPNTYDGEYSDINGKGDAGYSFTKTLRWEASCSCGADVIPATVLDPFVGSGTTLYVSRFLGRSGIGIDLNPANLSLIEQRVLDQKPVKPSKQDSRQINIFDLGEN